MGGRTENFTSIHLVTYFYEVARKDSELGQVRAIRVGPFCAGVLEDPKDAAELAEAVSLHVHGKNPVEIECEKVSYRG